MPPPRKSLKIRRIDYSPAGKTIEAFHASNASRRIILGPFGSGKSSCCVEEILKRGIEQEPNAEGIRKTRWAVIRNTYPELKLTTIKTWLEWIPEQLGKFYGTPPYQHNLSFKLADGTWVDLEALFLALDNQRDVTKLLSFELTGAWGNEVREIPKGVIDALDGRVGRFPSRQDGGPTWYGILGDTNMPDEDSWIHQLYEEQPEGWKFFRQPGGLIRAGDKWEANPEAENLKNLVEGYYTRAMSGKGEDFIKVYLASEFGYVQEGQPVFPEFTERIHMATSPFEPHPSMPISLGIDFGLTPACVFAQQRNRTQWRIFDEVTMWDMGARRFADEILKKLMGPYSNCRIGGVWGDPAGDQRAQTDERTPFDIIRAAGIPAIPAPSNDLTLRLEAVRRLLGTIAEGDPLILISPRCRMLRRGMLGGYRRERVYVKGKERFKDVPEKNNFSHVCDALQYLLIGAGEGRMLVRRDPGSMAKPSRGRTGNWNPLRMNRHGS